MKDVRDWLRDGDPVANEPPLPDADVQRLRRTIVAAADQAHTRAMPWWRPAAIVGLAMMLALAMGVNRWLIPVDRAAPGLSEGRASTAAMADGATRRQVQWIAPGGTRVIWIFNADFTP